MAVLLSVLLAVVMFVFYAVVIAFPFMWLWNYIMPEMFGLMTVTFWQALALSLIGRLLFGSTSSSSSK